MTSKICSSASVLVLAIALAGCTDGMKKTFGMEANPPDAFQVSTQAPLSLPPELGVLPNPNPGEPRPQQANAAQDGANTLVPASALTPAPSTASPGAQALLQQAGPTPPSGIRAEVNQNAMVASKPKGFVSSLLGSAPAPAPTVNATAEARRLQENEALGQPVTTGATPQTTDQNPGLLQKLLNLF
ncbi:MAG: hypothetical protein B7X08_05660 [Acidocella sp. 20-63-7]|nr:MAG: hypothetical protein B7X08_05660 [Acidocella sp. 20-63-7]HQT46367.1 DUF3035 domain-containing protein [Acidocella sp.]